MSASSRHHPRYLVGVVTALPSLLRGQVILFCLANRCKRSRRPAIAFFTPIKVSHSRGWIPVRTYIQTHTIPLPLFFVSRGGTSTDGKNTTAVADHRCRPLRPRPSGVWFGIPGKNHRRNTADVRTIHSCQQWSRGLSCPSSSSSSSSSSLLVLPLPLRL